MEFHLEKDILLCLSASDGECVLQKPSLIIYTNMFIKYLY